MTSPLLIIASGNRHKAQEIAAVLGERFRYASLADYPEAPSVVEDAATFEGNALKKARGLAEWLMQQPADRRPTEPFHVMADDSGLEVDALGGAPGVHSARFAAEETGSDGNAPDGANNAKLLRLLEQTPDDQRTARFRCVIALLKVEAAAGLQEPLIAQGACEGKIMREARGGHGFGYDPLFVPEGFQESFAELGNAVKNGLSHRARALGEVVRGLEERAGL